MTLRVRTQQLFRYPKFEIEIETYEKNHVSNECSGSEFRSGVVPALCERG
jgi:hypothetical protein